MDKFTLQNPVFATYVIAATLAILKLASMSWLTVVRMVQQNGGYRSPEDTKLTPMNKNPSPQQTDRNESVERVRRVHQNDLENLPLFIFSAGLFVLTDPSLLVARILFYGYVASRFAHSLAYLSAVTHDTRAKLWTPGSLILIFMTVRTLLAALSIV